MRLTKDELVNLVAKITAGDYATEEEGDELLTLIRGNVPHPRVTNVLFYSKERKSPEQMVDELLSYRPIVLAPPEDQR